MKIHVEYFAQARGAAGCSSESVELASNATLLSLVEILAAQRGAKLASLLLNSDGSLSRQVMFTVGDSQISPTAVVNLAHGDRVTIVPPISGG
jgi:molybdopterin converting factor small subunit